MVSVPIGLPYAYARFTSAKLTVILNYYAKDWVKIALIASLIEMVLIEWLKWLFEAMIPS